MRTRLLFSSRWIAIASCVVLNGCSLMPDLSRRKPGEHAFIAYWPPADNGKLRVAVKDNIDMRGIVTTAGSEYFLKNAPPAKKDAACLAIARQRDVQFVGKANLSEFAVAPSGFNEYFGTPRSPLSAWRRLIPGGSSSGCAVAVATGMADVAFGTDTAGSVRVPAACSGVVGLKTTFGLVPLDGVVPIEAEHLDTVGPLGKDVAATAQGMDLLQRGFAGRYAAAKTAKPTGASIRVGRLKLKGTNPRIDRAVDRALAEAGFQVVPLGEDFSAKWEQAKKDGNTLATAGAWMSDRPYLGKLGVAARTKTAILAGQLAYQSGYWKAVGRQKAWQNELRQIFRKVDIIALPTLQTTPPPLALNFKIGVLEALVLDRQNTVAVNFAGNPALAVPIPLRHGEVDLTSLQLVGPRRSEAELLNAGRIVEAAVKD
jgi:Asp-tRNA(Asn)/Glu-tRNA(Gln) amidotransferase A subunit family amidase